MIEAIMSIDREIMLFLQENVRNGILNPIMIFITTIGNTGAIWLILGAFLMFFKKHRKAGLYVILSVALCYVLNDMIIKEIVGRPRPFLTMPEIEVLVSKPGSFSFPSGHSCAGFAASYILTKFYGRKGATAYILSVLIALSRPYVGVHYPSDIVVGAIIGTLGTMALYRWVYPYFSEKFSRKKT